MRTFALLLLRALAYPAQDAVTTMYNHQVELAPRMDAAAGIAYHSFNHYGQMVICARMNDIVPPTIR